MNMHNNARLTPQGRLLLVQRVTDLGWTVRLAADAAGLSQRQAYRWLARYRAGGAAARAAQHLRVRRLRPAALAAQDSRHEHWHEVMAIVQKTRRRKMERRHLLR